MRLYGHARDAGTRRVLLAAAEKGHELELVQLDLAAGEHLRPAHLSRHPFGRIPALEDGSFALFEVGAILRYLDEALSGPRLVPATARARAQMEQWLGIDAAQLTPALEPLRAQLVFHPMFGARTDAGEVARARRELSEMLAVLERTLERAGDAPFLVGSLYSLADIALAPSLQCLVELGQQDLIRRHPQLARWWERVRMRPSARKVFEPAGACRERPRLRAVAGGLAEAR